MKTLFCTNTLMSIHQVVYASHIEFYTKTIRKFPDDKFAFFTPVRMTIDACRNAAVKVALDNELDYIMFIDDDVVLPPFAYERLRAANKDIVAGWTVIRGYPFDNMFFRFNERRELKNVNDLDVNATELIPVDAIGCSCVLIKCELLKKIPPPYFVTGTLHTEDIYFCMKAKKYVPEVEIFVDPLVKTPHMLALEAVTPENRAIRKRMEEELNPDLLKAKEIQSGDRGAAYLEQIGGV